MTNPTALNDSKSVSEYILKLDDSLAEPVETLRQIILSTDKRIGEQIKWNSPSFFYTGEMEAFDPKEYRRDIVVFNLRQKGHVLLVFPTGAKIEDTTGLLEGNYSDGRRIAKIRDKEDAEKKGKALQKIIKVWLQLVE